MATTSIEWTSTVHANGTITPGRSHHSCATALSRLAAMPGCVPCFVTSRPCYRAISSARQWRQRARSGAGDTHLHRHEQGAQSEPRLLLQISRLEPLQAADYARSRDSRLLCRCFPVLFIRRTVKH